MMGKLENLNLRATCSGVPCLDDFIARAGLRRWLRLCGFARYSSRGAEFKRRVVLGLMGANFIKNPACDGLRYLIRGEAVPARGVLQLELDF